MVDALGNEYPTSITVEFNNATPYVSLDTDSLLGLRLGILEAT